MASKGLIEYEEEMTGKIDLQRERWAGKLNKSIDVVLPSPGRQRVMNTCVPSDELLAAAAAGPGTTLGGPQ